MVFILSIVTRIQMEFWYGIKKTCVLFIATKFRGDMMRSCFVVAKSKYASLQRTNKEPANVFTCMRECHLRQYPDE